LFEAPVLLVRPAGASNQFFAVDSSTPRPQVRALELTDR
jgi:hypothetical protein